MGTRYVIFAQDLSQDAFCSLGMEGHSDIQVGNIKYYNKQQKKRSGSCGYKLALFKVLFEGIVII